MSTSKTRTKEEGITVILERIKETFLACIYFKVKEVCSHQLLPWLFFAWLQKKLKYEINVY